MKKRSVALSVILTNLWVLAVYFLTGVIDLIFFVTDVTILSISAIYIALALVTIIYFHDHISYPKQRIPLLWVAGTILLFMVLRALKYGPFHQPAIVAHYLWYLYYLPTLFIPFFFLVASFSYVLEGNKTKRILILSVAFLITLALFVLVMTNDLHQWVFSFRGEPETWDDNYSHNVVYYLVFAWDIVLFTIAFVILFRKSTIIVGKRHAWLSLIPVALGLTWAALDLLGLMPKIGGHNFLTEFPETLCFVSVGSILSMMKLGLISSNDDYGEFFKNTTTPAYLIDKTGTVVYQSKSAERLNFHDIPPSMGSLIKGDNMIRNIPIRGGSFVYSDDVGEINRLNEELNETNERLKEEQDLYRLINDLKEEQLSTEEKNALYDTIAKEVYEPSDKIRKLSEETEQDLSLFAKNMPLVCFYSVFIKRFSNLKLIASEKKKASLMELYLAISESLRYLGPFLITTSLVGSKETEIDGEILIESYIAFQKIIDSNLSRLSGVIISFDTEEGTLLKMVLEGKDLSFEKADYDKILISSLEEDGVYYLTFQEKEVAKNEIA